MKKIQYIMALVAVLSMVSCSESFRDRDPYGGMVTAEQFANLANKMEYSMNGVYSLLYTYGAHDVFGERSIDMYTDLFSGDMALTNYNYGWFYSDEQGLSVTARSGYLWSYYYTIIRNINLVLAQVAETSLQKDIDQYGFPTKGNEVYDAENKLVHTYTDAEINMMAYYAQALTMRGYAYDQLCTLFNPSVKDVASTDYGVEGWVSLPIYTETNFEESQQLDTLHHVYDRIEADLQEAIEYFDGLENAGWTIRSSKLEVDGTIARTILAYSYLNKANPSRMTSEWTIDAYKNAQKLAEEVIQSNRYSLLSQNELLTSGFNNVDTRCWMWGEDVTIETQTGLGSFFGQVDIHSYSYAWAGDTKVIDKLLFESIYSWDGRSAWFNDGKKNPTFDLCPDGKFFSAKSPNSTAADDIDREWLSDNIFLRYESVYLIAAEASYRRGEYDKAKDYLTAITDLRMLETNDSIAAVSAADYATYKAGLGQSNLLKEIYYNWRIEMWGEGYALQTWRRLGAECEENAEKTRGGNHCSGAGDKKQAGSVEYTFQMPSSETVYKPKPEGIELPNN